MKFVGILMVLAGLTLGAGAVNEFRYYGPETRQFWVGVFTTPAGLLFIFAGILLWRRGSDARQMVLIASLVMLTATVAATALAVMGPPATLVGVVSSLIAFAWTWRSRAVTV